MKAMTTTPTEAAGLISLALPPEPPAQANGYVRKPMPKLSAKDCWGRPLKASEKAAAKELWRFRENLMEELHDNVVKGFPSYIPGLRTAIAMITGAFSSKANLDIPLDDMYVLCGLRKGVAN